MTLTHYIGGKITGDSTDFASLSVNYPNLSTFIDFESLNEYILVDGVWSKIGVAPPLDDTDLKAYWKWDSSATPVPNDSQAVASLGVNADADITGGSFTQPPISVALGGNSVLFNGTTDRGQIGSNLSQWNFMHNQSALFTAIIWIKQTVTPQNGNDHIMSTIRQSGSEIGVALVLSLQVGGFRPLFMEFRNSGGIEDHVTIGTARMPDDTNWHMLAYQYDESLPSANAIISVDAGTPETFNKEIVKNNGNASFAMSLMSQPPTTGLLQDGNTDEWSVWNRILSSQELSDIYNNGEGRAIYV